MSDKNKKLPKMLTIKERISVIRLYEVLRDYSMLSDLFGVGIIAIKNIIKNSERIIDYYKQHSPYADERDITIPRIKIRTADKPLMSIEEIKKIQLLGECVNEALKRKQQLLTVQLIRATALEFLDIMELKDFKICKHWLDHFCYKYKIKLTDQEEPQVPLDPADLQDILEFCKNKLLTETDNEEIITMVNISNILHHQAECTGELSSLPEKGVNPKHLLINSDSDVLKVLKAVQQFAVNKCNYEALVIIARLEKRIQKKKK